MTSNNFTEDGAIQYIFERLGAESQLIKILNLINQGFKLIFLFFFISININQFLSFFQYNQGTILFAIHILKQDVCRNFMTKDVRTPEGWRIFIRLGDVIQVSINYSLISFYSYCLFSFFSKII